MNRQYEDPRALTRVLDEKKERYEEMRREVERGNLDEEDLIDAYLDIQELEDRVNFAWQDEEFEEDYARENCYW